MPSSALKKILKPGFVAFHSNKAEDLADVMSSWIQRHPLNPLEEEIILVQSNGMAEWVKMELARRGGVCAATRVELPSRFLWRTYRQILGRDAVPAESALDKVPMIWRLMQLLPDLISGPDFAPIAGFLKAGEPDRMLQLAAKLADLFDQYQNYRADWLDAWALGKDHLISATGALIPLPAEQRWQPQLWRAVLQMLDDKQKLCIRPALHQRVLARLASNEPLSSKIAQRVIVFGMSQIPWTTLQALAALSPYSQVMLAIPNPCRFYWGDIMDGRELLQSERRRQPHRNGKDLANLALDEMHLNAHPLLAAWGRQGRDFIRQLDVFDDAAQSQREFELARIDLFDDSEEDAHTPLLTQVQNRIRDLVPMAEHKEKPVAADDRSIVFHSAHSKARELEVLHDQLLDLLANSPSLHPRDVIVMVPDIEQMAPFIRAVFGQYKQSDARYIPYDIADMSTKASSPLIGAIDWLLGLSHQRCRMSELVDLLELPAIAERFGIESASLPKLTRWMTGAGIRWGLNDEHRNDLGLAACGDQNSAWFGLRRMLAGYASGTVAIDDPLDNYLNIDPYAEVAGLEAELAGSLAHLLQALIQWWRLSSTPATPDIWIERCRQLLDRMFKADSELDRQALNALNDGLDAWQSACEQAGFIGEVPLIVARMAWLDAIKTPSLNQRFRAGGVTFCTLMPMRAIPFDVVCLLGMNDGEYPRRSMRSDFDLMELSARPGDRSSRNDDRQLMLESLLSARRLLYVSWCGHSVRDNSEQPPSVLVSQLRDYLSAGWGSDVVANRTTQHPLQPFSRRYFEADMHTYAREWRRAHEPEIAIQSTDDDALSAFTADPNLPLTLSQLTHFLSKPAKAYFKKRLLVAFEQEQALNHDDECFTVDALHEYGIIQELLSAADNDQPVTLALAQLRKSGALPLSGLGDIKQHALQLTLNTMLQSWHEVQTRYPAEAKRVSVRLQSGDIVLEDWIDHLQVSSDGKIAWLELEPGKLLDGGKKAVARADKLLSPWIKSLAIAASGMSARGVLVGRDGIVEISPVAQDEAENTLSMLLTTWLAGMNSPLPLPPKTALASLTGKNAAAQYDGGYLIRGEAEEACMARVFPDYETLTQDGRFESLSHQVYAPLLDWISHHVNASFHVTEEAAL